MCVFLTWIRQVPKWGAESSAFQAFTGWIVVIQTRSSNAAIHYFVFDSAHTATHYTAAKKVGPHHTFLLLKLRCREKKNSTLERERVAIARLWNTTLWLICHEFCMHSAFRKYSPPCDYFSCCVATSNLNILKLIFFMLLLNDSLQKKKFNILIVIYK